MRRQILATKKVNILHPDKQPTLYIRGPLSRQGKNCFLNSKMPKKRESCAVRFPEHAVFGASQYFLRANFLFFFVPKCPTFVFFSESVTGAVTQRIGERVT